MVLYSFFTLPEAPTEISWQLTDNHEKSLLPVKKIAHFFDLGKS